MILRIKILPSSQNQWLGWFGDEVIKLKLIIKQEELLENALIRFLKEDLGIDEKNIQIVNIERDFITIKLPDEAWELFLTVVS